MNQGLVTSAVDMTLISAPNGPTTFRVELGYESKRPLEVIATFPVSPEPVVWTFSRELLADGMREPSGYGDVIVWPDIDADGVSHTRVWLRTPGGEAELSLESGALSDFLIRTWQLVPAGGESDYIDVDTALGQLLA